MVNQNSQQPQNTPSPCSVSQLLQQVRGAFGAYFRGVYLRAELFSASKSGRHSYLTLKDTEGDSQIRAIIFDSESRLRQWSQECNFYMEDFVKGAVVEVYGPLTVYDRMGTMQLQVERLRVMNGKGLLEQRLKEIQMRIIERGWHLQQYKKPIPLYPRKVGLVTSSNAAGLKDMLAIFKKNAPDIELVIYNCLVQGERAPQSIIEAINFANQQNYCDLLVVGRGGGGEEDLLAFWDEWVVGAVFNSRIPIVSAVGHEINKPFTDQVADAYAETPTEAARKICEPRLKLREAISALSDRIHKQMQNYLQKQTQLLANLSQILSLKDPLKIISDHLNDMAEYKKILDRSLKQKIVLEDRELKNLKYRLVSRKNTHLQSKEYELNTIINKFNEYKPTKSLEQREEVIKGIKERLNIIFSHKLKREESILSFNNQRLKTAIKAKSYYFKVEEEKLSSLKQKLHYHYLNTLNKEEEALQQYKVSLVRNLKEQAINKIHDLRSLSKDFFALDPLKPLERGYAMVVNTENKAITSIDNLKAGQEVSVLLKDGGFTSQVGEIFTDNKLNLNFTSKTSNSAKEEDKIKVSQVNKSLISDLNTSDILTGDNFSADTLTSLSQGGNKALPVNAELKNDFTKSKDTTITSKTVKEKKASKNTKNTTSSSHQRQRANFAQQALTELKESLDFFKKLS